MKFLFVGILVLSSLSAEANWTPLATTEINQSILGGAMLILPNRQVALVSGVDNTKISGEIGFARKAQLFREIISGSDLNNLSKKYSGAPRTSALLAQVKSLSSIPVQIK